MRILLAGIFALWLSASASAQTAHAPVEAYGRLPAIADVAISPDGRRIALAMSTAEGVAAIRIVDLDQDTPAITFGLPEKSQLRGVGWADDGRVIYIISQTFRPGEILPVGMGFEGSPRRVDYQRTGVINLADNRIELLTTNEADPWADQGAWLIAPIEGDPGFGRMIGRAPGQASRHSSVYRADLTTGRVRHAPPRGTNRDTIGFLLDEAGAPVVRYDSDERTNRWSVHIYDGVEPRLLLEEVSENGEPMSFAGLLADGRLVAYDAAGEFTVLSTVSRSDGSREILFQRENVEIGGALRDPWTRRVVGVSWTTDELQQHFFEADLQAALDRIKASVGESAQILSWSRDRRRFLIYLERGLDGGGYYIFYTGDEPIRRVGMRYPELAGSAQGDRQAITYRARDGVRIPAYLTYPPGDQLRNLPLVLFPHGGPHSRDTMEFDWWAAFMASRGYAVLQPNFRGSEGYGRAWEAAGRGQWGALMQTDIEDGVAALVRAGIVDPARVCIVGASYGGYAALAGAALTPERYKCAASIAGVSDLEMMLRVESAQTGGRHSMTSDYWRLSIGDRQEDREHIRSVSPANLADRVRIPILLIHGTDDTVVPIDQTRRMLSRLQAAGKDVRFVELRGDDHWLSDAPTRIQMLRELESFLAQHLGAPAPAQ